MNSSGDNNVLSLSQRLSSALGVKFEDCSLRGPIYRLQNSLIYHAECAGQPFPLMVKRCLMPNTLVTDTSTARVQYDALSRAKSVTVGDSRYNVPMPVALLEQEGVVVMEWIEGVGMTPLLLRLRGARAERLKLVAEAAEWLRRFHRSSGVTYARLAAREMLPRLTADPSPVLADEACREGIAALERTCGLVDALDVGGGYPHGDFKSDNLLVCSGRIVAIDIHHEEKNSVLFDIAMFLNHLELLALHPRGMRLAWERVDLIRAFLKRYFHGVTIPELPLVWVRLFVLLGAWIDLPQENPGWLRYHYMDLCYRRIASRLTRGLKALKA